MSTFNAKRMIDALLTETCPHEEGDGLGTAHDPVHYRKLECMRCVETEITRAYLIGLAQGRTELRVDEVQAVAP